MKLRNLLLSIMFFILSTLISSCSKSGGAGSTSSTGGNTSGTGGTVPGTSVSVDISGMTFTPSTITVKAGTTVKWSNSDYYSAHTVTSNDGGTFNSGNIPVGGSYSFTPTTAGTYPYHCTIHGAAMAGTLVVTQ